MNAKQVKTIKFAKSFTKELGKFVKAQNVEAEKQGLNANETRAVIALAFSMLGKNQKTFLKKAGLSGNW